MSGSATERTFIRPGEPIIARVVDRALRQVADNLNAIAEDL